MIAKEAHDYETEKLLYQLYFELAVLKSRVEAATPVVRAKCRDPLRSLLDQYKLVEAQVQATREAEDEIQIEQIAMTKTCLRELRDILASVGRWIWMQTAQ